MSEDFFWGMFTAVLICVGLFIVYLMVEYNRTHLYPFNERTCVVQWEAVTTCYDTPGVE